MKKLLIGAALVFSFSACIKEIDFPIGEVGEVLVVNATLTNETKFHQVKLSKTYDLEEESDPSVRGASVSVLVDGNTYTYTEIENGVYESEEAFKGEIGKEHVLIVETADGERYESANEIMPNSTEIVDIYPHLTNQINLDQTEVVEGVQFFINNNSSTSQENYFRFEWEDNWEILTPEWAYELRYDGCADSLGERSLAEIDVTRCYDSSISKELILGTSINSTSQDLKEQPIKFIGLDIPILRNRYSILVKQYTLTESAYSYYANIKESNDTNGSFFDQQKGAITGNIENVDDNTEIVLGFFEVANVTEKREFFRRSDYPEGFMTPDYGANCSAIVFETGSEELQEFLEQYIYVAFPAYIRYDDACEEDVGTQEYILKNCVDCRYGTSTLEPPYFWVD